MAQYFTVKAVFEVEDAKGKIKKQTEQYLVDAMSVTEAEEYELCAKLVELKSLIPTVKFTRKQIKQDILNIISEL